MLINKKGPYEHIHFTSILGLWLPQPNAEKGCCRSLLTKRPQILTFSTI